MAKGRLPGWRTTALRTPRGKVFAIHVIPEKDLIEHRETSKCPCGPDMEWVGPGLPMFSHHAEDGRELIEAHGIN